MEYLKDYPELSLKIEKILGKIPETPSSNGKYVRFISLQSDEIDPFVNFAESMNWLCYEIMEPDKDSDQEETTWGLEIPAYKLN